MTSKSFKDCSSTYYDSVTFSILTLELCPSLFLFFFLLFYLHRYCVKMKKKKVKDKKKVDCRTNLVS